MKAKCSKVVREHFEGLVPRTCPNCSRCFATFRGYILLTKRSVPTVSDDAELREGEIMKPTGTVVSANCPRGITLALRVRAYLFGKAIWFGIGSNLETDLQSVSHEDSRIRSRRSYVEK
jgi:hypothetical protein